MTEVAGPSWATYNLPLSDGSRPDSAAPLPALAEGDEHLLLQNGAWFCSLRWLVIAALLGLAALAGTAGNALLRHGIRLDPAWPLEAAAVLAVVNVTYLAMVRAARRGKRLALIALQGLWLQIVLDLAVLTVVIHYLGSLETYAPFMYLFHIVLACIFFPRPQSLLVTLSAMGMYLACILLESLGVIPFRSVLASSLMPDRNVVPLAIVAWDFLFCGVHFRHGVVSCVPSGRCFAAARRGNGRRQPAFGGRHGRAGAVHAPHDSPTEGAFCGHPRQHPTAVGRLLRAGPGPRRHRDRADRGPLRDAVAGNQGHAAIGQPPVARPESSSAGPDRVAGADPLLPGQLAAPGGQTGRRFR